jgi:hypothetical protein
MTGGRAPALPLVGRVRACALHRPSTSKARGNRGMALENHAVSHLRAGRIYPAFIGGPPGAYAAPLQRKLQGKLLSFTRKRRERSEWSISIMMRNIAIGLAAATVAIGGSTLTASAVYGKASSIGEGGTSERAKSHRFAEITPTQHERFGGTVGERFADLTPMQRERIGAFVRQRFAELTPRSMQPERLRGIVRERFADFSPTQRERISRFVRARYEELTALERAHLHRRGPYGRR